MSHTPLDSTDFSAKILKKVRYTHDAMIDEIIANPGIGQVELGEKFGFSKQWVSRVTCSDAFQARLALRKEELIDPLLVESVEERLRGVAMKSLENIQNHLEVLPGDMKTALKALEITTKAAGYGARGGDTNIQQNNYVVAVPQKIKNSEEWSQAHAPQSKHLEPPIEGELAE